MLNAQKAKLIIAACLSFFIGTFLALYTKNLPTFGAGVLVAAYFLVEFLTMLKNSKADKYIKVTALAVNADESRAGFEPMETWRFIPVNEDGEYLDKNGKYVITPGGQQINYVCVDAFNGHNDVTGYDALQKDDGTVVWGSAELIVYTCLGDAYNVRVACFNRA